MNWSHLPVTGGIYDQHPQLIDDWNVIFIAKSRYEKQEEAKEKAKQDRDQRKSTGRKMARGGRRR